MKVSIITVTYNSAATLKDTLDSVQKQDHPDVEHILVDGGSRDGTIELIKAATHVAKWVSEKDNGLYDAINKGIRMAQGEVIGILNSDDFFPNHSVISRIAAALEKGDTEAVYGDVAFVRPGNLRKIIRLYSSKHFHARKFGFGYMPAHPSFYVKSKCYLEYGLYKEDYIIAADYELLMRFIITHKIRCRYLPEIFVYMRTGGVSNKSFLSRFVLNKEIVRACRENGVNTNMAILSLKYFNKIFEFITPALRKSGK